MTNETFARAVEVREAIERIREMQASNYGVQDAITGVEINGSIVVRKMTKIGQLPEFARNRIIDAVKLTISDMLVELEAEFAQL